MAKYDEEEWEQVGTVWRKKPPKKDGFPWWGWVVIVVAGVAMFGGK